MKNNFLRLLELVSKIKSLGEENLFRQWLFGMTEVNNNPILHEFYEICGTLKDYIICNMSVTKTYENWTPCHIYWKYWMLCFDKYDMKKNETVDKTLEFCIRILIYSGILIVRFNNNYNQYFISNSNKHEYLDNKYYIDRVSYYEKRDAGIGDIVEPELRIFDISFMKDAAYIRETLYNA